jgi:magnesium transporter
MPATETSPGQPEDAKDRLLETVAAAPPEGMAAAVSDVHPALLADVLEAMPPERRLEVWAAADHRVRGETLTELHDEVLRGLAAEADPELLGHAMAPLQPDELADLEPHVPAEALNAALARMDRTKRLRLERVRRYPEDSAGGLMDVDAVTAEADMTVAGALDLLREMRRRGERPPEHMDSFFVVTSDDLLQGVLPLTDAVTLPPGTRVADVMIATRGIPVETPVSDVVHAFRDRDLVSAPVVNGAGMLLGRITVDDVVDVLTEEAERSILAPAGLDEDRDLFAPVRAALRQRGIWLGINLGTAFLAAMVISRFEATIEQLVALAVLMPVVASMGGVAGQQSLALVIRGLALNHVGRSNRWSLMRHEMANGAVIGAVFAVLVAVVAFLWYGHERLSLIIGAAMVLNVFVGTSMGTLYPLLLKRMNIDPALAGGMALTATTDVLGFFALLGLASLLLL